MTAVTTAMDSGKAATCRPRRKPVVRKTPAVSERLQLRDIVSMVHFNDPALQTFVDEVPPAAGAGCELFAPQGTMRCNECSAMVCAAQAGIKGNARLSSGFRVTCAACKVRLK